VASLSVVMTAFVKNAQLSFLPPLSCLCLAVGTPSNLALLSFLFFSFPPCTLGLPFPRKEIVAISHYGKLAFILCPPTPGSFLVEFLNVFVFLLMHLSRLAHLSRTLFVQHDQSPFPPSGLDQPKKSSFDCAASPRKPAGFSFLFALLKILIFPLQSGHSGSPPFFPFLFSYPS